MAPQFLDAWPPSFAEPVRYPLFGGGKRIRPALTLGAYQSIYGYDTDPSPALPAAAAVEMIHTYSLVHDDLPALDNDDERRGRPTVHIAFGEPCAILVGDTLLTQAFSVLAQAPLSAEVRIELVAALSDAAGYRGMIGGQVADVGLGGPVETLDTLTRLHTLKTGALIEASTLMGALVAQAQPDQRRALRAYGASVGLAFQLADDLLDADEDAGEAGPPSFVKLLGPAATRSEAHRYADQAIAAASELPHPALLQALARYTVDRTV